jgi:hypothetical protein
MTEVGRIESELQAIDFTQWLQSKLSTLASTPSILDFSSRTSVELLCITAEAFH